MTNFISRRCKSVAVGLAIFALGVTGCTSAEGGAEPEINPSASFAPGTSMQEIADRGTIRIGTKFDLSTIGAKNLKGEVEGFDVEIGQLIAAELGISPENIEWVETVSANREPYVQQEKVDLVIAYYAITPEREEVVTFGGPYLEGGLDLLVEAGNPKAISGPEDAEGKTVCGQSGSTGPAYLNAEHPEVNLVEFDTMSKCVDSLKQGQVDAVVQANHVLLAEMQKEPGEFELVGERFDPTEFGIGMLKGDSEMCEFVNGVLEEAFKSGAYDEAWEATIGTAANEDVAPDHPTLSTCE